MSEYRKCFISSDDDPNWVPGSTESAEFRIPITPTILNANGISLESATLPQLNYNIVVNINDNIQISFGDSGSHIVIIPAGKYTSIDNLLEIINTAIVASTHGAICANYNSATSKVFFYGTVADPILSVRFFSDLYYIFGFPGDGLSYSVTTADYTADGETYDLVIEAPSTYNHAGGFTSMYIIIEDLPIEPNSLCASGDSWLADSAVLAKVPVDYTTLINNYRPTNESDRQILWFSRPVAVSTLHISYWGYSGVFGKWFKFTFPGARIEMVLRIHF